MNPALLAVAATETRGLDEEDAELLRKARENADKVVTSTPEPRRRLGYGSVFCIIVNRMIGTGIFRTPNKVIAGTNSVGVSMLFWSFGAVAAMAGVLLYIEFGLTTPIYKWRGIKISIPRSGGELNYLNEILRRPAYLATCVFAIAFILVGNMASNGISFAEHVLEAAGHPVDNGQANGAIRGIALGVATFACLIHGLWRRGGIWLNNAFAVIKIMILLLIVVLGFVALGGHFTTIPAASSNFSNSFSNLRSDSYGYTEAFLAVIFAHGGFNQANYVLSEIDRPRKILKRASLVAVLTVCILYMLVNAAYMIVVPKEIQLESTDVAGQFFEMTLGTLHNNSDVGPRVLSAFMAISSLGNIIVMTYTAARVKQEIAKEGVLPFSKYIASNTRISLSGYFTRHPRSTTEHASSSEETPVYALFLHWIFSVLLVLGTWSMRHSDAYSILVGLYSYSIDAFFGFFLGIGLIYLRLKSDSYWSSFSHSNKVVSYAAAILFAIANAFPLIASFAPPQATNTEALRITWPWFTVPTIGVSLIAAGVAYWLGFYFFLPHIGSRAGKTLKVDRQPLFHEEQGYPVQWHEIVSFSWIVDHGDEDSLFSQRS